MQKRVALYLRVSTNDQTTKNQRRELEAVAKRQEWKIVQVFEDTGISGTKDRAQRPGLDALWKGVARRDFELVASWSIDRLGRSLVQVVNLMNELNEKCPLLLWNSLFDLSVRKSLIFLQSSNAQVKGGSKFRGIQAREDFSGMERLTLSGCRHSNQFN